MPERYLPPATVDRTQVWWIRLATRFDGQRAISELERQSTLSQTPMFTFAWLTTLRDVRRWCHRITHIPASLEDTLL